MASYDIISLVGTPGNIINLLTWTNPTTYVAGPITFNFKYTHVRYSLGSAPSDRSEGTFLANVSGSGENVYTTHNNITNGTPYYYSLFSVFGASSPPGAIIYYGPYSVGPIIPASSAQFFTDVCASFTKLEHNTKLYDRAEKIYTTDLIIWLADGQIQRKVPIIAALNAIKPAHTVIRVFWEPYYVAHTTNAHFASGSFDSDVYSIENGTLINKVATIDSSFGGDIGL